MRLSNKYPFLEDYFEKALNAKNKALPQSLLFYGNDLNAQYEIAAEIARMLNCQKDKSDECDCLNCKWIREGTHPAVMTISRCDNKPDDDKSKTVISLKQAKMIKEILMNASDFHRVFIFCDRDKDRNILGLNPLNFQEEAANSLLKIIEEPQPGVTFIFLTRYIEDVLSTIISRSQCFFVPSFLPVNYDYSDIDRVFTDYFNFERKNIFDISQSLQNLTKKIPTETILDEMQNYILALLKSNPKKVELIKHIEIIELSKTEAKNGIKPANIFDDICLKLIH